MWKKQKSEESKNKKLSEKGKGDVDYNYKILKNIIFAQKEYEDYLTFFRLLNDEIGEETVPLRYIIDAIKEKAKHQGIPEAYKLLELFDHVLMNADAWKKNRSKLLAFFDSLKQPTSINVDVGPGGIAQITDKGIINNPQLPQDDKE